MKFEKKENLAIDFMAEAVIKYFSPPQTGTSAMKAGSERHEAMTAIQKPTDASSEITGS